MSTEDSCSIPVHTTTKGHISFYIILISNNCLNKMVQLSIGESLCTSQSNNPGVGVCGGECVHIRRTWKKNDPQTTLTTAAQCHPTASHPFRTQK